MGAHLSTMTNRTPNSGKQSYIHNPPTLDIAMQATIHADGRSIFHALTMPEYIEVWMCLPVVDTRSRVNVLRVSQSYRIDFYRLGELDTSITGLFKICQPDKLLFTWRKFGVLDDAQSVVNIHIQEGSDQSSVKLRHVGLPSFEECRWHRQMWNNSFRKLAGLFERSGMVDTAISVNADMSL
jgi:uncharacterized protein YndB with AHSA1/START domain